MFARIAFEQFGHQYSPMENLSRSVSLFLDHHNGVPNAPSPADWALALGVELEHYMNVGFAAYVAVVRNRGAIARRLLEADHVAPIWWPLQPARALEILDQHFIRGLPALHEAETPDELPGCERWSFNPLVETPLVSMRGISSRHRYTS